MFSLRFNIIFAVGYSALAFLVLIQQTCNAETTYSCPPSSCGNIPSIRYPFRLNTDPEDCGSKRYEISCENNLAVLYLNYSFYNLRSGKHYVEAIDYNNYTIRLLEADVKERSCSSRYGRYMDYYSYYSLYDRISTGYLYGRLVFVNCLNPVKDSPSYVEITNSLDASSFACVGDGTNSSTSSYSQHLRGSNYSYVMIRTVASDSDNNYAMFDGPSVSDLEDSCRVELIIRTSLWPKDVSNLSYLDVRRSLEYGFELSWLYYACCRNNPENKCNLSDEFKRAYCQEPHLYFELGYYIRQLVDVLLFVIRYLINKLVWESRNYELPSLLDTVYTSSEYNIEYDIDYGYRGEQRLLTKRIPIWLAFLRLLLSELLLLFVAHHLLLFVFGVPCVIAFLVYTWRRRHRSMYGAVEEFLQNQDNLIVPISYSYSDIKKITNGFKDKLGEGGYGSVYKGKLRSGRYCAVKLLGKSKANTRSDGQDFINEVATIGRIHHVNVVQLIGYCANWSKRALVYEFMPNGSLDKYVFPQEGRPPIQQINNEKMFEIAVGIARGIEYLHRGCDIQILHFDIKPHNILLDENFLPKVSDFGLAKLYPTDNSIVSLTGARGTLGYMAPELIYKNIGGISYKSDVYSFGMLLMEMAGRRKNLNAFTEHLSRVYFPSWAYDQLQEGKDIDLINADATEKERKVTNKMIIVAFWCIQLNPADRPSMHEVVKMLEGEVESLEMPPKPFVSSQEK